jgi:hypothetical protein
MVRPRPLQSGRATDARTRTAASLLGVNSFESLNACVRKPNASRHLHGRGQFASVWGKTAGGATARAETDGRALPVACACYTARRLRRFATTDLMTSFPLPVFGKGGDTSLAAARRS